MAASDGARAATLAAASSAAVILAREALQRRRRGRREGALGQGLEAAWDAARDVLWPTLEESAAAAGRYVAEHAPEGVRDTLLPRFLDAFHEAREQREADDVRPARERTENGGDR